MRGTFITFEGSEGSGKSTQARLLSRYLKSKGKRVLHIREPGGVAISEKIRGILLDVKNKKMSDTTETLLYMAARAQLVEEIIEPALKKGKIVIADRFLDSTIVYQGYGNRVNLKLIHTLGKHVTQGIKPHLTFVFDIGVEKGLSRTGKTKDRIEQRSLFYHQRVRNGYLAIAKKEPGRIKVINAKGSKSEIQNRLRRYINRLLKI